MQSSIHTLAAPAMFFAGSCTPMRPNKRYHILREDFRTIADYDNSNADMLRIAENITNQKIAELRRKFHIAEDHLPHEDDLWFELPLRSAEELALHAHGKSTYARCLLDHAAPGKPKSLIELGYIRRRFIARPGFDQLDAPATTQYRDDTGEFIIVLNEHGDYFGEDNKLHNAVCEGYTDVRRQYLYCIDAVNAATACLDWEDPPEPAPRWPSTIKTKRSGVPAQETTFPTASNALEDAMQSSAAQGGTYVTGESIVSFENQNIIDCAQMSTDGSCESQRLRNAPWTPETLIGLSGAVLDIPDSGTASPELWDEEWYQPALSLIKATEGLDPRRAWERIDLSTRYMATPGSPSWFQRPIEQGGRKVKTPITLRHIANNFERQWVDFKDHQWYPEHTTPYDGPPIEETATYQSGYSAIEEPDAIEVVAETLPKLPPDAGLTLEETETLKEQILEEYPTLPLGREELSPGRYAIGIEYADDQWILIASRKDWMDPSPEMQIRIDEAAEYGRAMGYGPPRGQQ